MVFSSRTTRTYLALVIMSSSFGNKPRPRLAIIDVDDFQDEVDRTTSVSPTMIDLTQREEIDLTISDDDDFTVSHVRPASNIYPAVGRALVSAVFPDWRLPLTGTSRTFRVSRSVAFVSNHSKFAAHPQNNGWGLRYLHGDHSPPRHKHARTMISLIWIVMVKKLVYGSGRKLRR